MPAPARNRTMNILSFMSANFVARELGYGMTQGWMQGDATTQAFYKPLETFEQRFDALLGDIAADGFTAMDLWGAHLHHAWIFYHHWKLMKQFQNLHSQKNTTKKLTAKVLLKF